LKPAFSIQRYPGPFFGKAFAILTKKAFTPLFLGPSPHFLPLDWVLLIEEKRGFFPPSTFLLTQLLALFFHVDVLMWAHPRTLHSPVPRHSHGGALFMSLMAPAYLFGSKPNSKRWFVPKIPFPIVSGRASPLPNAGFFFSKLCLRPLTPNMSPCFPHGGGISSRRFGLDVGRLFLFQSTPNKPRPPSGTSAVITFPVSCC